MGESSVKNRKNLVNRNNFFEIWAPKRQKPGLPGFCAMRYAVSDQFSEVMPSMIQ